MQGDSTRSTDVLVQVAKKRVSNYIERPFIPYSEFYSVILHFILFAYLLRESRKRLSSELFLLFVLVGGSISVELIDLLFLCSRGKESES